MLQFSWSVLSICYWGCFEIMKDFDEIMGERGMESIPSNSDLVFCTNLWRNFFGYCDFYKRSWIKYSCLRWFCQQSFGNLQSPLTSWLLLYPFNFELQFTWRFRLQACFSTLMLFLGGETARSWTPDLLIASTMPWTTAPWAAITWVISCEINTVNKWIIVQFCR